MHVRFRALVQREAERLHGLLVEREKLGLWDKSFETPGEPRTKCP
jgi:hypothetical protein